MQERVLKFLDESKQQQVAEMLPYLSKLIATCRNPDGSLKLPKATLLFNRKWALLYNHNSIKEQTTLIGYSENISDIAHMHITGHPLASPLVKSTRYVLFEKELGVEDPDITSLPMARECLEYVNYMSKRYIEVTQTLAEFVYNHKYTKRVVEFLKKPENVERALQKWVNEQTMLNKGQVPSPKAIEEQRKRILSNLEEGRVFDDIKKFVLDYSRVYLLSSIKTSIGYSLSARTLADIIPSMISNPRKEDRERGYAIWREARKISPVILSEEAFGESEYKRRVEGELREWMEARFKGLMEYEQNPTPLNLITPSKIRMDTDRFNAALVVFPFVDAPLEKIYKSLTKEDIQQVLAVAHKYRGNSPHLFDAITHTGLLIEVVMPWHAYRDIFRHRRGSRSMQLLTTRLGYEVPEIFVSAGIVEEYKRDMERAMEIYEGVRKINPRVAEKLVPFGFRVRALHSWHPLQISYVVNLRGDISKGNRSYVMFARSLKQEFARVFPETAKYFVVDTREYPAELWKKGYRWWDTEGIHIFKENETG